MASDRKNNPIVFFVASSVLMTLGWWLSYFPFFIFLGLAPLFAITDRVSSVVWEKMEWVFLAVSISFWASYHFNSGSIVMALLLGIGFTLPFIGFVWVRQILGPRVGKICIILFWLALEYVLLKVYPLKSRFLADVFGTQPDWTLWTGYLGTSLWILSVNYLAYLSFFSTTPFRWYWILLTSISFIAPTVYYNFFTDTFAFGVSRIDMIELYSGKRPNLDSTYLERGEWIVRTAAWISTLILIFTLVKGQTTKR